MILRQKPALTAVEFRLLNCIFKKFICRAVADFAVYKRCVQPWRFMARGNGGSAVRVLIPKYKMSYSEMAWFAAQINMQRWRFFYGRMAIQKRLKQLKLTAPSKKIEDGENSIAKKICELSGTFSNIMKE